MACGTFRRSGAADHLRTPPTDGAVRLYPRRLSLMRQEEANARDAGNARSPQAADMRFARDPAKRIGWHAERACKHRETGKADDAQHLSAGMTFRRQDGRNEHGVRPGSCCFDHRPLRMTCRSDQNMRRDAAAAADIALGQMDACNTEPPAKLKVACGEKDAGFSSCGR